MFFWTFILWAILSRITFNEEPPAARAVKTLFVIWAIEVCASMALTMFYGGQLMSNLGIWLGGVTLACVLLGVLWWLFLRWAWEEPEAL